MWEIKSKVDQKFEKYLKMLTWDLRKNDKNNYEVFEMCILF